MAVKEKIGIVTVVYERKEEFVLVHIEHSRLNEI